MAHVAQFDVRNYVRVITEYADVVSMIRHVFPYTWRTPQGIADGFNMFCVNIGKALTDKIPASEICPTTFISESSRGSVGKMAQEKVPPH